MPGLVTWIRGVGVCLSLTISGVAASSFIVTPVMLLKLVSDRAFFWVIHWFLQTYLIFCGILCHFGIGYKMRISADTPEQGVMTTKENAVIIMNHRSEIDWLAFFEFGYFRAQSTLACKIVLKVRGACTLHCMSMHCRVLQLPSCYSDSGWPSHRVPAVCLGLFRRTYATEHSHASARAWMVHARRGLPIRCAAMG